MDEIATLFAGVEVIPGVRSENDREDTRDDVTPHGRPGSDRPSQDERRDGNPEAGKRGEPARPFGE